MAAAFLTGQDEWDRGYKVEKGVQWARLEPYQRALIAFLSGIKNEA